MKTQIEDWKKKDIMFVSTRASDHVIKCLQHYSCVTITAPSGVGKSFISRHTALYLQKKKGYEIVLVYSPTDIRDYYDPGKRTVFIVDNICGNFTANQQEIDNWKQMLTVIHTIIEEKLCKIIVSCRLQVYKDDKFKILSPFKSCECNLISDKLCLSPAEKRNIAETYIGTRVKNIDDLSKNIDFFPLLCSLYDEKNNADVKEFFRNPFDFYEIQLDKLREHGDEGNYKICSLVLCVLFNNRLKEKWFQGKVKNEQRHVIEDACEACGISRSTSKERLKKALDTLDGTFICNHNGIYRTYHDKLFDFLAHYFGQQMIECLIEHGDSRLVHERFIWQRSNDKKSGIDFIIEIPDDYLESYLDRFIKDWSVGKVADVFSNDNMKESSFRQRLLQYLRQLDISQQVTLANTKDTVLPKQSCGSGNTSLILLCYYGYTDMVQWVLHKNVDVDHCRDDGVTGLRMACQKGHTNIVRLLLERNPNVDLCKNDCCSPLYMASQNGYIEIVRLLLEKNPKIDLCNINGCSPLFLASQNGHTEVVRLLLQKNPNVDQRRKDGCSPLYVASQEGHLEIVRLLLEKNPNVDLCRNNDCSPLYMACQSGHTEIVRLLLQKNPNVDLRTNKGLTPLFIASQNEHTEVVRLLLENNPNVDLCTNNDCSPLYMACQFGNTEVIRLLLTKNPNVDKINKNGVTALYVACQEGYTAIVNMLLEKNSNVDLCNKNGCSPLYMASHKGHADIVKLLLEKNPNVNLRRKDGVTALYWACTKGYTSIVNMLLEKNSNVDLCDNNGCSPLDMANQKGHTEVVRLLLEKKAIVDFL